MKHFVAGLALLVGIISSAYAISPEVAGIYEGTVSIAQAQFETQKIIKSRHKAIVTLEENGDVFFTTDPLSYQFYGTAVGGPYHAYMRFDSSQIVGSMTLHLDKPGKLNLNFHTAWNTADGHCSEGKGKLKKVSGPRVP